MKIVIGICGFGNGHVTRQASILEKLLADKHDIILLCHDNSTRYMRDFFPDVTMFDMKVPTQIPKNDGIDFLASATAERNAIPYSHALLYKAIHEVQQRFGKPDVVVSDYEMMSAQIAYALDVPLVTIDQPSRFLGYDFPNLNEYTPDEHRIRLRMFFPKADKRVSTSFNKVSYTAIPEYPVEQIPPIIRKEVAARRQDIISPNRFLVYLSPNGLISQTIDEFIQGMKRFSDKEFVVFSKFVEPGTDANVEFRAFEQELFLDEFEQAAGVISTAGHSLITEAVYFRKPMYLLPFAEYNQMYCAAAVAEEGIGVVQHNFDDDAFGAFVENLPQYRERFTTSDTLYQTFDGDQKFVDMLQAYEPEHQALL